jgi:predicted DNA-binding transcriptional regulator AlpA
MRTSIETVDSRQIADMMGLTRAHVTDTVTKRPGFPKPVLKLSQRNVRWSLVEVLQWIKQETSRRV